MSEAALSAEELQALRDASQSLGAEAAAEASPAGEAGPSKEQAGGSGLSAASTDGAGGNGKPGRQGAPADIRPAQLAAPGRQASKRLPALLQRLPLMLKRQRQLVGTVMRQSLDVSLAEPTIVPVAEMAKMVTGWLWGAVIRLADKEEPIAWVGLPVPFGYHLIEVAFGAIPGQPGNLIDKRQLTRIEQETLRPFLEQVSAALAPELNLAKLGATQLVPLQNPFGFRGQRTEESGILLQHLVPINGGTLAYDVLLLPKALEQLEAKSQRSEAQALLQKAESMAAHALAAEVEVVANLGTTAVRVADLASLTPGQIIWLEHNQADPIELLVEGQAKFTAMPMQRAGAVGVAILERL